MRLNHVGPVCDVLGSNLGPCTNGVREGVLGGGLQGRKSPQNGPKGGPKGRETHAGARLWVCGGVV